MVVEILEELGYNVLDAENSERALELASSYKGKIQLLLTDVVMPRISGADLAEKLLKDHPGLKVLFMSGYADEEVLKFGIEKGRTELIAKPFTLQALAERVRQVLDA